MSIGNVLFRLKRYIVAVYHRRYYIDLYSTIKHGKFSLIRARGECCRINIIFYNYRFILYAVYAFKIIIRYIIVIGGGLVFKNGKLRAPRKIFI